MASRGFRGIDTTGLGALVVRLGQTATDLQLKGYTVDSLLRGQSERGVATSVAAALSTVDRWAEDRQRDLLWRRDTIIAGQRSGAALVFGFGSLDPSYLAEFAATATYNPADWEREYRRWFAQRHPAGAAAELRAIQERIDNWPGSDNDPILDDLIRQAQEWRDAAGASEETMVDVAQAIEDGETPEEAGLPDYLFPPDYLRELREHAAQLGGIEHLTQERDDLLDELSDNIYGDPERAHELAGEFSEKQNDLIAAQRALTDPALGNIGRVHEFLSTSPFLDYVARQRAAGSYLAAHITEDHESLPELETIGELLVAGGATEMQTFFDSLGPAGTASIPAMLKNAAATDRPGGDAAEALRAFSEALGRASRAGLSFTGSDILPPIWDDEFPFPMDSHPALLFLYGRFDEEFIIDAALRPLEDEEHFQIILDIGATSFPLIGSIEDVPNGEMVDFRLILLERVAELGPETASQFITEATDRDVLDVLLYPYRGFADGGTAAGAIVAQLAADTNNARTVIEAIASGGPVDAGTAAGAEMMFVPHLNALIQTQSTNGLATPISPLGTMDPTVLDEFLEVIYRSGAGEELREQVDDLILYEITTTIDTNAASARTAIIDFNEALGEMAGRIEGARHVAGEEMARHTDGVNAARSQIIGMLLEAGVGVITPGGTLVSVAGGMAADVGVGALMDRLFPQNAFQLFYKSQYDELVGRSTTVEQGTIGLLDELGLIDKSEAPADTTSRAYEEWLDETYAAGYKIDDWVGTISEIYDKADKVRLEVESQD